MSHMEDYKSELARLLAQFGSNVRRARMRRRPYCSQERLAIDADLHRTEIVRIERGLVEPRLSTMLILSQALSVTLDELADGLQAPVERRPSPTSSRSL